MVETFENLPKKLVLLRDIEYRSVHLMTTPTTSLLVKTSYSPFNSPWTNTYQVIFDHFLIVLCQELSNE